MYSVDMSDTNWPEEQGVVAALLAGNRERREAASRELDSAKYELRTLLWRGQAAAMDVADMADEAGISRDTAHRILKEAGTVSWKQKQSWATQVLATVPRGDFAQNKFRMMLQMDLYNALGSKPEDMPRSAEGIFARATEQVRTIGGEPNFEPRVDSQELANLPDWPTEAYEIIQRSTGPEARFQLRLHGVPREDWRSTVEEVARDLRKHGGIEPTYIDRTGPEGTTSDGRRVGWELLKDFD
jgi:hypothetical protein